MASSLLSMSLAYEPMLLSEKPLQWYSGHVHTFWLQQFNFLGILRYPYIDHPEREDE